MSLLATIVAILTDPGGPVLASAGISARHRSYRVAILTDPGGPVLDRLASHWRKTKDVAILTDPGGPVLGLRHSGSVQ